MVREVKQSMKKIVFYLMMVGMKWGNRIMPGLLRRLVRYVAVNEVIACGLMDKGNQPIVIYSPQMQREHRIGLWKDKQFNERPTGDSEPFIGQLVLKARTLDAKQGEVFRILAKHKAKDKQVHSPDIVMKMRTDYRDELLICQKIPTGFLWTWKKIPAEYEAMLYFLGFEDPDGDGRIGIYTRELHFTYPEKKEGILFLNGKNPELDNGKEYQATLVVVDYNGWVPLVAGSRFTL